MTQAGRPDVKQGGGEKIQDELDRARLGYNSDGTG